MAACRPTGTSPSRSRSRTDWCRSHQPAALLPVRRVCQTERECERASAAGAGAGAGVAAGPSGRAWGFVVVLAGWCQAGWQYWQTARCRLPLPPAVTNSQ